MERLLSKTIYIINIFLFVSFSECFSGIYDTSLPNIEKYNTYIYILVFITCYVYLLMKSSKDKLKVLSKNLLMLSFGILVFFITIMNTNNKEAIISSIMLFGIIIYCVTLAEIYNTKTILKIIVVSQSIVVIITYLSIIIYPEYSLIYETRGLVYKGLFSNKNGLGANMAFTIIIYNLYIKSLKNKFIKIKYILLEIMAIILLLLSNSKTAIIICVLPICIYNVYKLLKVKIDISYLIAIIYCAIFYLIFNAEKYNALFMKIFNRDLTLTNRTIIWQNCFEVILNKPWFGYGFYNIWNDGNSIGNYIRYNSSKVLGSFSGAHNGFIEWMLQIGILGCILLVFLLLTTTKKMKVISKVNNLEFEFSFKYIFYIMLFYISERTAYYNSFKIIILFLVIGIINKNYDFYKRKLQNK